MRQFCRAVPNRTLGYFLSPRSYATLAAQIKPGDSLHGFTVKQVVLENIEHKLMEKGQRSPRIRTCSCPTTT